MEGHAHHLKKTKVGFLHSGQFYVMPRTEKDRQARIFSTSSQVHTNIDQHFKKNVAKKLRQSHSFTRGVHRVGDQ